MEGLCLVVGLSLVVLNIIFNISTLWKAFLWSFVIAIITAICFSIIFVYIYIGIPKQDEYRYISSAEQIVELEKELVSLKNSREIVLDDSNEVENIDLKIEDTIKRLKNIKRWQELQTFTAYGDKFKCWVLLLGQPSTGIEELTRYYLYGDSKDYKSTIGVQFLRRNVIVQDKYVELTIWDVAVDETFQFFFPSRFRNKNGAIIMYDVTHSNTLNHLSEWVQLIREKNGNIPIMLIGNNIDLVEACEVPKEEGEKIAEKYNLSAFFEISTKTGENVEEAFEDLAKIIINHSQKTKSYTSNNQ